MVIVWRKHSLFLVAVSAAIQVDCSPPPKPVVGPESGRVDKLMASAVGVLQTEGFSHSFATYACGPTDGPAWTVYLLNTRSQAVPPTTDYIRVTMNGTADEVAHQTVSWP